MKSMTYQYTYGFSAYTNNNAYGKYCMSYIYYLVYRTMPH